MTESYIVQFVGFISNLPVTGFTEQWIEFAQPYSEKSSSITLQQQVQTRCRYNYISKHKWPGSDFQFSFMGKRKSDYFPERSVKVIQIGGYIKMHGTEIYPKTPYTVLAFLKQEEPVMDDYRETGLSVQHNEYSAFYESCLYGYVFEFFATEAMLPELLAHLKLKTDIDIAVYRDCTPVKKNVPKLARNKA
jgi:hypothetical protein